MGSRRQKNALHPAEGEVRLRLGAIGMSPLGVEVVATVDGVGDDVYGYASGDRVAMRAPGSRPGFQRLVSERELIGIPKDISFEAVAGRLPGALLARTIVRQLRRVVPGDRVEVAPDSLDIHRFVVAWVKYLGAFVVEASASAGEGQRPADVVVRPQDYASARRWRHGPGLAQLAAADVFEALREGAFDGIPVSIRPLSVAAEVHEQMSAGSWTDPVVLLPESAMVAA